MSLTSGSFEYEERVTTGDYQHKAARAIVQFDDPKDIGAARELVMFQVRVAVGLVEDKFGQLTRKTLPQIVTEVKPEIEANPRNLSANGHPIPIEFPESDEPQGPRFYSDAELIAACRDKQAAGTDGAVIRKLIFQYTGSPGKTVISLDREGDTRERFMVALEAL